MLPPSGSRATVRRVPSGNGFPSASCTRPAIRCPGPTTVGGASFTVSRSATVSRAALATPYKRKLSSVP